MAEAIDILLKLKDLYDAVKSRIDAFKDNKTESSNLMERLGFFVSAIESIHDSLPGGHFPLVIRSQLKKLDAILEDIERYLDPLKTRQRQGTSGMLSFAYNLSFTKKNEEELKRFNQKLDRVRSDLHLANDTFKMNFSRKSKSSNDLVIMNYGEQELESVKSVATKLTFSESLEKSPRSLLTDLLEIMPLRVNPYDTKYGFKDIAAFIGKGTPYYDCYIIYSSKAETLFAKKLFDFLERNQIYAFLDVECCAPGRRKSCKLWWEGNVGSEHFFSAGLRSSRKVICLMSKQGLEDASDSSKSHIDDELLIQYQAALQLRDTLKDKAAAEVFLLPVLVDLYSSQGEYKVFEVNPKSFPDKVDPTQAYTVERLRMKVSGKDKHKMKGMYDILTVLRGKNADKLGAEASESILRMISNLCALEEENRSIIGGDEAILALLLRIAQKYKSNPFVSKQALSAFRYIAEDNTGKEILGERGGIEVVMNIANEHVNNFAVMEQGVGAISNLTEDNEDNANKLVEFGAHTFTVNAMNQHGQNSTDVTSSGFDAMKNLAISPENIEEIQSSGGLEGIVHAIWEHLHDEGVTSAGYETLDRLASRTSVRERLGGVLSERKDVSEGLLQMEDNSCSSLTASNLTTIIKKDRNRGGNNIPPPPPINAIRRNQSQDTLHSFIDRQEILSGHIGAITALIQLDNGKLVSSANDRFLKVWNTVSSESSLKTLRGHTDVINCVIQLKSGVIASCGNDNTIRLWNVDTGVCTATFKGHTRWVMTIIQLRDGRLVSGSDDKTIKIWNVNTGYCVNRLRGHMKWVKCLLELDDGYLVSGTGSKGPVNCIIQLSDGRVASASTAGFIRFWDYIYSGSSINSFAISKTAINTCIQLRDGRIVAGTSDGSITCWDAETGNCVNHLNHIHQRVINVIIQLKDDRLATGSGDTSIHILDLDSLQ